MADAAKPAAEEKKPAAEEKKPEEGEKKDGEKKEGAEGAEGEKKEGAEGATIPGQDPKTKKCVGEDTCAGKGAAEAFKGPGALLDGAKKKLDDGVKNGVKTIGVVLTNPARCATLAVGAVPAMINGIGKSISGAFDGITFSINNTFKAVESKGFTGFFAPFKIANAMFLGKLQGVINNIALGPDADKILSDPKLTAKILFDKLVFRSKMYKLAIKDAEFRGVFKVWIGEYVNTLLATLKIAQPEIDRINKEIKTIIEGMGDNIGESLGHAITNVIASAVSALPVVGGIVSAVKSADQLGQEIINACKPPIAKGAGIIMPVVNGFNKQKSRLNCEVTKLENKVKPVITKIENKMNAMTDKLGTGIAKTTAKVDNKIVKTANKLQKGGGTTSAAVTMKTKKHIQQTEKRITRLLSRFTRRKHKTNYTRRLSRF